MSAAAAAVAPPRRWLPWIGAALGGLADPASYDDLLDGLPETDDARLRPVVERLRTLALVWGDDDELRLVRPVREALGAYIGAGR